MKVYFSDAGIKGSFDAADNFFTQSKEEQHAFIKVKAGIVLTDAAIIGRNELPTASATKGFSAEGFFEKWSQTNLAHIIDPNEDPNTWMLKVFYANMLISNPGDNTFINAIGCLLDPGVLTGKKAPSKKELTYKLALKIVANNVDYAKSVFLRSNARKILLSKNDWEEDELRKALDALLSLKG